MSAVPVDIVDRAAKPKCVHCDQRLEPHKRGGFQGKKFGGGTQDSADTCRFCIFQFAAGCTSCAKGTPHVRL